MQIKSKYKIARRLGPGIFEKTQTAKFARREAERKVKGRPRPKSNFGTQLLEKQKVRYTYGINERQFLKYVRTIIDAKSMNPDEILYERLERRIDNIIYRAGFAPTRRAARQLVSHGHVLLNNHRTNVPSAEAYPGDTVAIRPQSTTKTIFATLDEKLKEITAPAWLSRDDKKKEIKVQGMPKLVRTEVPFDLSLILEFYRRS